MKPRHIFCLPSVSVRTVLIALIAVLLTFSGRHSARAAGEDYSPIVRRVAHLPSDSILHLGDKYLEQKKQEEAMVLYLVVCNRFKDDMPDSEKQQCALGHLKAGNVYYLRNSYPNALEMYVKGLKIYETCKTQKEISRFYNNIGNIYCVFGEYEKGLSYYKKGYEYSGKYGDRNTKYKLAVNMTGICTYFSNHKEARFYYRESERLKDSKNPENIFMGQFNYGLILSSEHHYHEALKLFLNLNEYIKQHNIAPKYVCSSYQQTYKAYQKLGRNDSALIYLRLCLQTARKYDVEHSFLETLRDYSEVYEAEGNTAMSQKYKAEYLTLKDSIFNVREFDIVKNAQFIYEMDKINKHITELQTRERERTLTINRQRKAMAGVTVGALIIMAFLIVVYRQKRKLQKSYSDLYSVNRNFTETTEQLRRRNRTLKEELEVCQKEIEENRLTANKPDKKEPKTDEQQETQKYQTSNLNDSQKQKLAEAITNVMENTLEYCSTEFTLDRLAQLVNSNSKYVSQVINDTFNKNFSNYVNEYRVHQACMRLTDTANYGNYTIKAIAESLGYKSHTTFIAVFKKTTGITPSLYQKKALEGKG